MHSILWVWSILTLIQFSTAINCTNNSHIDQVGNGLTVGFEVNCVEQATYLYIKNSNYNSNWFGVVFRNTMVPAFAVIFTTGKSSEVARSGALYTYHLTQRNINNVSYQPQIDWTMINQNISHNHAQLYYSASFALTPWWPQQPMNEITFRYALGSSLILNKHIYYSNTITYNMTNGTVIITDEIKTLEFIHGMIMWFTWSFLATIGIFSSRFRLVVETHITNKCLSCHWFCIHHSLQTIVFLLTTVSFAIALYFTHELGVQHFRDVHMILGLVIAIITVLQPCNAALRPHVPEKGEKRSIARCIWEIIHKLSGYSAWIIALANIYIGMQLLETTKTWIVYQIVWIVFLVCFGCILEMCNIALPEKQNVNDISELQNGKSKTRTSLLSHNQYSNKPNALYTMTSYLEDDSVM